MENPTPPTQWLDLPTLPGALQTLTGADIHLWLIPLQQPTEVLRTCAAVLSPDELARAERFRFQHLRDRFTVAHAALRHILATYLRALPSRLTFDYTPQGKPSLSPRINPYQLTFNLSHSGDLALLALTAKSRIGIDIEHREPKRDLADIATRNFSPAEAAALFSLAEPQRTEAFYACWTLKEAYLKATGDGLSTPLDSFDVTFPPIAPARLTRIASSSTEPQRWQARSFLVEDHAAALIVEGQNHTIYRATWSPQTGQTP